MGELLLTSSLLVCLKKKTQKLSFVGKLEWTFSAFPL